MSSRPPNLPHSLLNTLGSKEAARAFLEKLAAALVHGAGPHADVKQREVSATASLLLEVVNLVRFALPYMVTKVPVTGVLLQREEESQHEEERTYASADGVALPALCVVGDAAPVRFTVPGERRGTIGGSGVWLTGDGRFFSLGYTGTWDANARTREWRSTLTFLTLEEAALVADPVRVATALAVECHNRQPDGDTATRARRVELLNAVTALLRR
ncbi:hypothetical protein [Corallococcus terminator]|nr:hypothetical protein [Corallococcus terminator]